MASHSLAQITIGNLEIMGYSVAGEETVVAVPQLDVCFDIGKAPDQVIPINHVLLSHGHMDHAAGFAYYLSQRNFCGMSPGTLLVPENHLPAIRQILDGWGRLDGNAVPGNLVGVKVGDEHRIKPNLVARVFPTKHSAGSVGYSIIEKRRKLKAEYVGLSGPQIVKLKEQGVEIDRPLDIPIVTYIGDTQYVDFSQLEYVANSKILIVECTFYEDEHKPRADAGKHMHIEQFAKLSADLRNEHIIISHTTQRTSVREIRRIIKNTLPGEVRDRVILLMDQRRADRPPAEGAEPSSRA